MRFDSPLVWPNGARCAVMLTFDVDADLVWLDIDPTAVDRPKTRSIGEYGPRRGIARILQVLDHYGIRASFMVPGHNAITYRDPIRAIGEHGHELGNHGFMHSNLSLLDAAKQREALQHANDVIEEVTGQRPVGFRAPAGDITLDTLRLMPELGFTWTSCTRGDDRPFFLEIDGKPSSIVEIPAHWELDDFPYFMFNYVPPFPAGQSRIASYSSVLNLWKHEFDAYYDLGLCYVIMFHPQTIGTPGRIAILEELIAHMKGRPDVWFATGSEVANWWRQLGRANDPGDPLHVFAQVQQRV